MNTRLLIAAALLMATSSCANATKTEGEMQREQSLRDSECRYLARTKSNVCRTSFLELAADPSRFDGKYIEITGFALAKEGLTYLFLSRDSYVYGAARGGIDILVGDEALASFNEVARDDTKPVTVTGRFDLIHGRLPGSLGVISGEGLDFYIAHLPWEAPTPPPQDQE